MQVLGFDLVFAVASVLRDSRVFCTRKLGIQRFVASSLLRVSRVFSTCKLWIQRFIVASVVRGSRIYCVRDSKFCSCVCSYGFEYFCACELGIILGFFVACSICVVIFASQTLMTHYEFVAKSHIVPRCTIINSR